MPEPHIDPSDRDPAGIEPADAYHVADRVWVYRAGSWHAGVVELSSPRAATVTYRTGGGRGTGVDTVTAQYVLPRVEFDTLLDRQPVQVLRQAS